MKTQKKHFYYYFIKHTNSCGRTTYTNFKASSLQDLALLLFSLYGSNYRRYCALISVRDCETNKIKIL